MVFKSRKKTKGRKTLKKNLSLSEQTFSIKQQFPQFEVTHQENKVIWVGDIQPQPLSCCYTVKIEYGLTGTPKIWIVSPELRAYKNRPIPHMYAQERLCLYYPKAEEWKRSMWISQTIIPWISLWLHYYEYWSVTGEWLGGGIEHS
ncbi:TPA: hypothetical protein SAX15_000345 [Bacillus cereus]|mgnify:CR=1 FL=1|nr:hypothetical protein [Bacillus cereus]